MRDLFRLMLLPIQAPMLLVLVGVSTYMGMHWSRAIDASGSQMQELATLVWSAECLQALLIVVVCTMPDLLLRQVSTLMAASRVVSLVVTLLAVTIGGLYLLHLNVLANVLILGSAVLLARLDLLRVRVVPPPLVLAGVLTLLVLGGANFGRMLVR
jgi:TRAP-type uncharacterized transport system fused permease subunit